MDLNHLDVFVRVAATGSFTDAARALGVPKSTVSRAVAALEEDLGVGLLHRTTRSVSLTTAGAALYARAEARLRALHEAVEGLPELEEEPSGDLRVSATADFAAEILSELIVTFTRRYPRVRVELSATTRVVDLVKEGFDVAFRFARSLPDSALVARKVGEVSLELFASPAYLAARGTPRRPEDLAGHDLLGLPDIDHMPLLGPESLRIPMRPRIMSDDMFFLRQAVRHGAGISVLSSFLAEADVRAGTLVRVLPRWHVPTGSIWMVVPGGGPSPRRLEVFRAHVVEGLAAATLRPSPPG